jgi:hypothetical protein
LLEMLKAWHIGGAAKELLLPAVAEIGGQKIGDRDIETENLAFVVAGGRLAILNTDGHAKLMPEKGKNL